jgi:hypothetical protein
MSPMIRELLKPVRLGVSLAILLTAPANARGALALSRVTNEVFVGVCGVRQVDFSSTAWQTNSAPIQYDDHLAIMFFCRTGAPFLLLPDRDVNFIRFGMRGPGGQAVTKTSLGRRWGSNVDHFPAKPGLGRDDRMATFEPTPRRDGETGLSGGPSLPSPRDLFQMDKAGVYQLTVEVHLMKQAMLTSTNWVWQHLAIPPLTVSVERPPERRP